MRLSMLVKRLHAKHGNLSRDECGLVVSTILRGIGKHLVSGGRVEIRNFGAFTVKTGSARLSRNPRTGNPIVVPAKARPHFKAGSKLRDGVKATATPANNGKKRVVLG